MFVLGVKTDQIVHFPHSFSYLKTKMNKNIDVIEYNYGAEIT
jgi:hypothetical protein